MRVVQVSFYRDPQNRSADALLHAWPSLVDVAQSAHSAGIDVTIVQAHHADQTIAHDGVEVRFTTDAAAQVHALAPDVLHIHGITHAEAVRSNGGSNGKAFRVLVQDHGGGVPARWRQRLRRRRLHGVHGVAFTAYEQADAYRFMLPPTIKVFEVLESSTHFQPGDQNEARALTGLGGDPCLLWVGRLDANKDPLTVLDAVRRAVAQLPGLQLYCCYGATDLLPDVQAVIERSADLRERVHLLGAVPHERVQQLARAADLYVSASHSEGSGYALIEAIACGLTPIVTDIPSFRQITGRGALGALVPLRDAQATANALVVHAHASRPVQRAAALEHFQRNLSFAAVGRQLRAAYEALLRMKIGLIVPGGVDRSGTQRSIPILLWLIERIARVHEVHVFALRQEPEPCTYPLLGATVHNIGRRPRRARALAAIHAEHSRARFDVLHAFWAVPQGVIAAAASKLLRVPVLLDLVGGDLASLPALDYGALRGRRGHAWLQFAARHAARITTQSTFMQHRAEALGIRAERLPLGVSIQNWPLGEPRAALQSPVRLLHVGSLNAVKDHGTLLRAVRLLQDRGVDYRLDLIGIDTLNGQVQRVAAELGVAERTTFHGHVAHAELPAHYAAADVVIVSSQHESGPVVAQEAALSGRPVVGTRVGFLADWAPAAALAVPVAQPQALADALMAVLQDDALRIQLARAAQQIAKSEDADWSAARVLELYEGIAGRARRAPSLSA